MLSDEKIQANSLIGYEYTDVVILQVLKHITQMLFRFAHEEEALEMRQQQNE